MDREDRVSKIIVFIFCFIMLAVPASAAKLPHPLKTPKTCEIYLWPSDDDDDYQEYALICKKPLSKRMRGWVFFDKERTKDRRYQTRVWYSRRDSWRMEEKSYCKIRTCRPYSIIIYKIFSCQHLSTQNPFL